MMECDMKAVSIGTKRKSEVLDTCLQQMKACFLDARVNKVKLLNAMAIFFNRSNRPGRDEQRNSGEIVRLCGTCSESNMLLRRKPDGSFMVGCSGYPQCRNVVWLPGSISEAAVTPQVCNSCTPGPVFMIQFKFRRMEIPPNYDVNHLGCIGGCDEILRQLTEICGTGPRNLSSTPASTARGQRTTGNAQGASTRQAVCIYCRQTGHSSDVCPSQNLQPRNIQPNSRNSQNAASGEASVPCNSCGTSCSVRTANTENNRGRRFYSCRDCSFFLWEDSIGTNNTRGSATHTNNSGTSNNRANARGGRGRRGRGRAGSSEGTFVSATGDPISNRCFICGDPSHFANACPNRGM